MVMVNAMDVNVTTTATFTATTGPGEDFGTLQYFEVAYLVLVVIIGTLGNLLVILSIVYARKIHKTGNIFVVNLAVADLLVTGFVIPTVIASVIKGENALNDVGCDAVGVMVTVSCTCSIYNLMFIAANRCCSIAKPMSYDEIFSHKHENMMVFGIWAWAVVLVLPIIFNKGGVVRYNKDGFVCYWSDDGQEWYRVFITLLAVFLPLAITALCYGRLFYAVVSSTRRIQSISATNTSVQNNSILNREQRLFRTLFTTVVVFTICWVPFGLDSLIKGDTAPHAKRVFDWLALTNSSVNFIIYGALNSGFRKGYRNVILFIFCCRKQDTNNATRNVNYTSDSFTSMRRQNNLIS